MRHFYVNEMLQVVGKEKGHSLRNGLLILCETIV
ncbi:hypothetical protein UTI89UKE3_003 [Escherichia phage vB_EcoP-UTI89UKE3]|uniref:Uncharacterized protein n=1 Tax=Escherichia phage vB_EcoP-UTI89UKE2 TaxID=2865826 RepID=A0AAE7XTK2_9CAUD|nr:hypothetical protein UTI89UKE2_003 [Escherichia phage vB_EcoP-UTI89UKE2]QZI84604.1 hypothetical protein UTI89UKE3_003 [Escherichia phage vB_EcoP-UTI89UKE3]